MIKKICLCIVLILPLTLKANNITQNFGYTFCNYHKFTFLFIDVYDIFLCINNKEYLYPEKIFNTSFSLIIDYARDFNKDELAESSITEMNKYSVIKKEIQQEYYTQLMSIFPNVKKGDIIETRYSPNKGIYFYHNKSLLSSVSDQKFSKMFLKIWLHKDNEYKQMLQDLFANK